MSEQTSSIVSRVWALCNPLRDDGVSYGDYLEQLTYLIFLKMSDEYSRPPYKRNIGIPAGYAWSDVNNLKVRNWKICIKPRWKSWASRAASSVRFLKAPSIRSAMSPFCIAWCR